MGGAGSRIAGPLAKRRDGATEPALGSDGAGAQATGRSGCCEPRASWGTGILVMSLEEEQLFRRRRTRPVRQAGMRAVGPGAPWGPSITGSPAPSSREAASFCHPGGLAAGSTGLAQEEGLGTMKPHPCWSIPAARRAGGPPAPPPPPTPRQGRPLLLYGSEGVVGATAQAWSGRARRADTGREPSCAGGRGVRESGGPRAFGAAPPASSSAGFSTAEGR